MKILDITTKTREILRDISKSPHYGDEIIHRGISSAVRHLCSMRPEVRYGSNGALHDVDDIVAPDDNGEIDVSERFADGIAYYAASRCYDSDSVDTVNLQLAQSCLQRAIQEFQK